MATELESAGMKAEDNAEYNKKSNELKQQELKFRLKGADSPSARKEITAAQAPVPQAAVSPAPLSLTRSSILFLSIMCMNPTFARLGKLL